MHHPDEKRRSLRLGFAFGPSAIAGVAAVALLWAQFRGFDVLDEATYLLLYQNPADNPDTHTHFERMARPLWLLCGQDIVAFRLATLGVASALVCFFWSRLRRLALPAGAALTFAPIWLTAMAGVTWVPVALTYNSLAGLFLLAALPVMLWLAGYGPEGRPSAAWSAPGLLLTAMLVAGLFLAKPPAAAAFAVCSAILLAGSPGISTRRRLQIALTGGALLLALFGLVAYRWSRPDFNPATEFNYAGLQITPAWVLSSLRRYGAEFAAFWVHFRVDLAWVAAPAILAATAAGRARRQPAIPDNWPAVSLGLVLLSIVAIAGARSLWDGSFSRAVSGEASRFHLLLWFCLLPAWLAGTGRRRGEGSDRAVPLALLAVLFVLPLISSFGSTNAVHVSALHLRIFWAAGLLLVARDIATALRASWFLPATAAILSLGAASHVFTGHLAKPYMFQPPLWRQTEAVEVGFPATTLRLDPALAGFIRGLRGTLDRHGYRPGQDVFGFFNLPGPVFAAGAKSPGAPWYFGTWYAESDVDGGKIRQVPVERRQAAWIVSQGDLSAFRVRFREAGLDFPDGYELLGEMTNPVSGLPTRVWRPRNVRASLAPDAGNP